MNIFLLIIIVLSIHSTIADFTIIRQIPRQNISLNTNQFIFEINRTINKPIFSSFISFYNATSNTSFYQINVANDTVHVNYTNNTLIFCYPPGNIIFRTNDSIYITFDTGVLFSNSSINSTAQSSFDFWNLRFFSDEINAISTTSVEYSSISTEMTSATATTMPTITSVVRNSTTLYVVLGESPPTRSAQLGMGLGITFISIVIIFEILYFKYCYVKDLY